MSKPATQAAGLGGIACPLSLVSFNGGLHDKSVKNVAKTPFGFCWVHLHSLFSSGILQVPSGASYSILGSPHVL
jgi:hypothetical protein